MYDRRSRIRRDFLDQPEQLARRFRWAGIFNLLLVGPTLLFVVIYYIMRHAEEFRSAPLAASVSGRQWTKYAKWSFRGFCELPHQFEARLAAGLDEVEKYAAMHTGRNTLLNSVKRAVKYVMGAFLAGLLLVALSDDTKLFYPHDEYLATLRLAMYTHHFPPSWRAVTNAT